MSEWPHSTVLERRAEAVAPARLDPRRLARVERAPASLDGQPTTRLILTFRAIGCAYGRRPEGGCTMCGFAPMTTGGDPVAATDLITQFEQAISTPGALDGVGEVDLYNSGSFLADEEFPPEARAHVLRRLGDTAVRRVLIESRPEHVHADEVAAARAALGPRELEVGMGLESADDRVREVLINKGFGRAEFERAVAVLGEAGARLLAYVMVKPMGLTEREAIEDAVATARYVFDVAAEHGVAARAALEPSFVPPGTSLERALLAGRYQPPSLWSVVEIVRRVHAAGELLVGLGDEGLSPTCAPSGCERCTPALRAALAEYNHTRDLRALQALDFGCCHVEYR